MQMADEERKQAASGETKNPAERRQAVRRRTYRGAKVLLNSRSSVIDCVVRDMSSSGARLSFQDLQPLPQRFQLLINELGTYDCEIVRVVGTEYGVRFIPKA
jgi:PilZ domain-containing protein